jgi:hypothetical protein
VRPVDSDTARLSPSQRAALAHVLDLVRQQEVFARPRVTEVLRRAGCGTATHREAMECIRAHARVVIHFHPDRFGIKPIPVAEALLQEGVYRNQFETGRSSGGLSAFPGGPRDLWERTLFGGAYHAEGVTDSDRPKYGALELVRYPDGPIPRFGSCYFVLRPSVSKCTSFTFAGSEDPRATERLGTIDRMDNIMAALFAEIEAGGTAAPPWPPFRAPTLGVPNLTVARLLNVLRELASPRKDPAGLVAGRVLDTQIEAQVHGPGMCSCTMVPRPVTRQTQRPDSTRFYKRFGGWPVELVTGFNVILNGFFGITALVLAMTGVFGVMAYSVSRRTREIGVRVALGAATDDVLRMVLGQGLRTIVIGITIGVVTALALTRTVTSLLFGVTATDPLTFISVTLLLVGAALLACYIPAQRAARVDPMVALRCE